MTHHPIHEAPRSWLAEIARTARERRDTAVRRWSADPHVRAALRAGARIEERPGFHTEAVEMVQTLVHWMTDRGAAGATAPEDLREMALLDLPDGGPTFRSILLDYPADRVRTDAATGRETLSVILAGFCVALPAEDADTHDRRQEIHKDLLYGTGRIGTPALHVLSEMTRPGVLPRVAQSPCLSADLAVVAEAAVLELRAVSIEHGTPEAARTPAIPEISS